MYPVSSQTTVACCHWGILIVTLIHLKYFSLPYTLIKLFEACGAIYKSATKPALNSLHGPYRFLWTAFFLHPAHQLCVSPSPSEKSSESVLCRVLFFPPSRFLGWMGGYHCLILHCFKQILFLFSLMHSLQCCGWDLLSSCSFSEGRVKIMHLTYAKVVVGGSKNSPRKEQIIIALQESCDPVVMVHETVILKLAIWPVLSLSLIHI